METSNIELFDSKSGKLTKCNCLITITCWFIPILIYHTIKFNPHIWFNCPEWEIQSFLDPKAGLSAFSSYQDVHNVTGQDLTHL